MLLEPVEAIPEQVARLRIEAGRRLVEQQQVGSLMSARAMVRRRFMPPDSGSTWFFAALRQLHEVEQLLGALAGLAVATGRSSGRR